MSNEEELKTPGQTAFAFDWGEEHFIHLIFLKEAIVLVWILKSLARHLGFI